MTIKIHRLLKSDLSRVDTLNVIASGMSNTSGMTISHFAYAPKQTEATIPYAIDIVSEYVPSINSIDFCVVIRTKVDLTAPGINEKTIEGIGNDIGEYDYTDNVPAKPLDLPPGFTQFYKG